MVHFCAVTNIIFKIDQTNIDIEAYEREAEAKENLRNKFKFSDVIVPYSPTFIPLSSPRASQILMEFSYFWLSKLSHLESYSACFHAQWMEETLNLSVPLLINPSIPRLVTLTLLY